MCLGSFVLRSYFILVSLPPTREGQRRNHQMGPMGRVQGPVKADKNGHSTGSTP